MPTTQGNLPNDLLTIKDIFSKYKISKVTLQSWIKQKRLTTRRIGRKHFISESDLFNMPKRNEVQQ